ncbi:hypothetical protein [Aeromicrobium sp.]|uniref:hypothetical protein n=1 Tax=Aeromicrobium sp. TaxID=1871063 RepID=UPI0030C0DB74
MTEANEPEVVTPSGGGGCLKLIGVFVLLFALMTGCFALKDYFDEQGATKDDGARTIPVRMGVTDDTFTIRPEGRIFTDHGETYLTISALRSETDPDNRTPQLKAEVMYEGIDVPFTCEMNRPYIWGSFTEYDELQLACGKMGHDTAESAVITGS